MDAVITKLERLHPLSSQDRTAIRDLPVRLAPFGPRKFIIRSGDHPTACPILLDGYAHRSKLVLGGTRQIVSLHIPGDLLGVQHLELSEADHDVVTLTEANVAMVPLDSLRNLIAARPSIARALSRDTLVQASITREWVVNVGQRDGITRVAHMLCEFATRHAAAGFGAPNRFQLPMRQEDIGDATGLTPVHVNRMLKELERLGLISRVKSEFKILNWPEMQRFADFKPSYLYLDARA